MPDFIPGLTLARILFTESVEPLLAERAPVLPYAAALIGPGSDVLGFDTARSMDHGWGPRLLLFINDTDIETWSPKLDHLFRSALPATVAGFPANFAEFEIETGTSHLVEGAEGEPINHGITITSSRRWLNQRLGVGDTADLDAATWVTLSEQALLEITAGEIFRDDIGAITRVRAELAWYPDDVWRYLMAAQWKRIDQVEPFVGRSGEVGDDLGSQLVAMSLVRDVMKLAFLMERRYAPYPKWVGTGFSGLATAPVLTPHLDRARFASNWRDREAGLVAAVEILANRHNAMGLTAWVDPKPRPFFDRPFQVMFSARFADVLMASITDPDVLALPLHLGGLDQYIDSTDAMHAQGLHRAIRKWIGDSNS